MGGRLVSFHCVEMDVFDLKIECADLPTLNRLKHVCGRPKDLEVLSKLEAIIHLNHG